MESENINITQKTPKWYVIHVYSSYEFMVKNNLEKIFTILINIPNQTFNYEKNVSYDIPLIPNSKMYHYGAFLHEGNKQEQFDALFSMIQRNVQTASTKTENNFQDFAQRKILKLQNKI